jgi:hypothetical protein
MVTRRCGGCGKVLPAPQGRGRSRRYCTDACQQQAYRKRRKHTAPADLDNAILDYARRLDYAYVYVESDLEIAEGVSHWQAFLRSKRTTHQMREQVYEMLHQMFGDE